jgi:uncharacterized damage-inducible protein DinB
VSNPRAEDRAVDADGDPRYDPSSALATRTYGVDRGVDMNPGMHDLAGHHAWATAQLLAFCQGLDEATLEATAPGTFGTIIETLQHLIDSEASYFFRLTGAWPEPQWRGDKVVGLDVLAERAAVLASTLERFLAGDWDAERLGEARGDEGEVFAVRAGIFLAQALHHANEHRAHVCTILGALGYEPPDVSAWGYALDTGRMMLKTTPPAESAAGIPRP